MSQQQDDYSLDSITRMEQLLNDLLTDECFRSKQLPATGEDFSFEIMRTWENVKNHIQYLEKIIRNSDKLI